MARQIVATRWLFFSDTRHFCPFNFRTKMGPVWRPKLEADFPPLASEVLMSRSLGDSLAYVFLLKLSPLVSWMQVKDAARRSVTPSPPLDLLELTSSSRYCLILNLELQHLYG